MGIWQVFKIWCKRRRCNIGNLFTLTPDILKLAQDGIDDIINQLGKSVLLIYPPRMVRCVNRVYDPIGKKSGNIWLSGGPIQFPSGNICPLCNGVGTHAEQVTKPITLLCHFDKKKFVGDVPSHIQLANGSIQTKGYLSDLEAVLQSRQMILQPDLSPFIKWRYELASEPDNPSNIIQERYFFCFWKRVGG